MTEAEKAYGAWLFANPYTDPYYAEAAFIDGFEAGRESMDSWDGLMEQLDRHYPTDLMAKWPDDPGPRIVALIRQINDIRQEGDSR